MSPIDICQWLEVTLGCRKCRGESQSQGCCCSLMRRTRHFCTLRIIWCHSHITKNYLPEWQQRSETLALDMHLPLLLTKNGKLHKEQHSGAGTKSASWYSPNLVLNALLG